MEKIHARLTLEDIAKEINISRTTIYKVVNRKGNVSEKTKNAVLNALEKYNYVPNNNARNLALNKDYIIALINYISPDATYFATTIEAGIQQVIQEYGDHGLAIHSFTSPAYDPGQQLKDVVTAYESGIRHFIISAADPERMAPAVKHLVENGCKVILLSKQIPFTEYDAFIGIDDYKSGKLAAQVICKMIPADGRLQLLVAKESQSNHASSTARFQGFLDHLNANFPQIHLLPILYELDGPEAIDAALTKRLRTEKVDGIFDLTYRLDILSHIMIRENKTEIVLTGIDLFPEIEQYIADGVIDAVIFQDIKAQTVLACHLLFERMCYGKEITQKSYYSKLEIVMSENMEYFLE